MATTSSSPQTITFPGFLLPSETPDLVHSNFSYNRRVLESVDVPSSVLGDVFFLSEEKIDAIRGLVADGFHANGGIRSSGRVGPVLATIFFHETKTGNFVAFYDRDWSVVLRSVDGSLTKLIVTKDVYVGDPDQLDGETRLSLDLPHGFFD